MTSSWILTLIGLISTVNFYPHILRHFPPTLLLLHASRWSPQTGLRISNLWWVHTWYLSTIGWINISRIKFWQLWWIENQECYMWWFDHVYTGPAGTSHCTKNWHATTSTGFLEMGLGREPMKTWTCEKYHTWFGMTEFKSWEGMYGI